MVDFSKRVQSNRLTKIVDPLQLYKTLDRAHDKGPLRPSQEGVLEKWFANRQIHRDSIIKLHTGQGKTLVGLLILQSSLNEGAGPAIYLCPNNFLLEQTCEQAKQFGISVCTADPDLPDEFLTSKSILVTSVQKMFNGLTKFGLYKRAIEVGIVLMDDAHACSDTIRDSFKLRIPNTQPEYAALLTLFSEDLEQQGFGTYADITNGVYDAVLPVPYWSWIEKENEIARIISKGSQKDFIKFSWPLLKDILGHCQCVISGTSIEIEPFIPPLEAIGSYNNSKRRIFMSATVTDDAFLIKGLQLKPETISAPVTYELEKWSGEKMILIPGLIDESLNSAEIIHMFAADNPNRKHGVVSLVSSEANTRGWSKSGALIANRDNLYNVISSLKNGDFKRTVVLVNRYDGIDLPDDACRVLIIDGRPYSPSLIDMYEENCRPSSDTTKVRIIRTIEQGLGRSVRGEKDYSVIIITGADITRIVRDTANRSFLSEQMATQIKIGIEIAEMAAQEIEDGTPAKDALNNLIKQCLSRDADWKEFYNEQMEDVKPSSSDKSVLKKYAIEMIAEEQYQDGLTQNAIQTLQTAIDKNPEDCDTAWYLQSMARYLYSTNRDESQRMQLAAYNKDKFLLKPRSGVQVSQLTIVSQGRMERIIDWVSSCGDYPQLEIRLNDIMNKLEFGVKADKFEGALNEISIALGLLGERPDKEWKEGPDNLWALDSDHYVVFECKNEVSLERSEISKTEAEQMNRSCAWFNRYYSGRKSSNIIIHPARSLSKSGGFLQTVTVMREKELKQFKKAIKGFFKEFETLNFKDLSPTHIQKLITEKRLELKDIMVNYSLPIQTRVAD